MIEELLVLFIGCFFLNQRDISKEIDRKGEDKVLKDLFGVSRPTCIV